MDIVCLGEILIDMFPAEVGRSMLEVTSFLPKPGGAPANVAVAASRLGAKSAFMGKVGEDVFGHYLEDVLKQEGVETRGLCYDPHARTTLVFIAMPDEHTAEYVFYRNPGADMLLAPDELDYELLSQTRCLHFGSLSLAEEPIRSAAHEAAQLARAAGALISFDVNYRPTLWQTPQHAYERVMEVLPFVDLLKVNETELAILAGKGEVEAASETLLELGPQACVVTLGSKGSFFRTPGGSAFVPAFRVRTVDATGCGDAFIAGLLSQLVSAVDWRSRLAFDPMQKSVRYANAVGALTAQTQGVIPALPPAARVVEFLSNHPE